MARKDTHVDDIAPNLRYVHSGSLHCATISIPLHEVDEFRQWCKDQSLEPKGDWSAPIDWGANGPPPVKTFVFMLIPKGKIMALKLAWARYDIENIPRMLG